ncbi:MAG: hypothetical protein IPK82_41260 [Polyangiaceae bacterium]|nr:hypothetical protein [Polyangiaceae bacterium]
MNLKNLPQSHGPSRSVGLVLPLVLVGCSVPSYSYRAVNAPSSVRVEPTVFATQLPPEKPAGSVRVEALGMEDVSTSDGESPALRTRVTLVNQDDPVAWTLDVRDVVGEFGSWGATAPGLVNGAMKDLPIVAAERGTSGSIDLFFWLPEDATDAQDVPRHSVRLRVHTGSSEHEVVAEFERVELESEPPMAAVGYAPYWWYDPLWWGSPFHMGGPFGPTFSWGAGFAFGGSWNAPPITAIPPVASPERVPARPRFFSASPVRPSIGPARGIGGRPGR